MKLGIVGLPNVGKSTLFNALTNAGAQAQNYPFCTIDPNIGVAVVPDERLDVLEDMYKAKSKVYAAIEFYDIAGLVRGASKGEGLGNQFLSHIREVEAIIHVLRCFEDDNVIHVDGDVNPLRDIETINLELILSDLEMLDRRIDKTAKAYKGDKTLKDILELMERVKQHLEAGNSVRSMELSAEEREEVSKMNLLSFKPVIYAANISEDDMMAEDADNPYLAAIKDFADKEHSGLISFCAKIEEELLGLEKEEAAAFLAELGVKEAGLSKLIKASYSLLDLMSFLTAGEKEVRAWTIRKGTSAKNAAGKIHTDIERGFIKAEIIEYDTLVREGSYNACKDKGLIRFEGKDYIMQDGDIVNFRFNV